MSDAKRSTAVSVERSLTSDVILDRASFESAMDAVRPLVRPESTVVVSVLRDVFFLKCKGHGIECEVKGLLAKASLVAADQRLELELEADPLIRLRDYATSENISLRGIPLDLLDGGTWKDFWCKLISGALEIDWQFSSGATYPLDKKEPRALSVFVPSALRDALRAVMPYAGFKGGPSLWEQIINDAGNGNSCLWAAHPGAKRTFVSSGVPALLFNIARGTASALADVLRFVQQDPRIGQFNLSKIRIEDDNIACVVEGCGDLLAPISIKPRAPDMTLDVSGRELALAIETIRTQCKPKDALTLAYDETGLVLSCAVAGGDARIDVPSARREGPSTASVGGMLRQADLSNLVLWQDSPLVVEFSDVLTVNEQSDGNQVTTYLALHKENKKTAV